MVVGWGSLTEVVAGRVAAGVVPQAVLGVSAGGETRVAAFGEAAREDAVVRLSSMTKPLIAALALMLVEDGVLALGDGVERWIPELADRRVLLRPDGPSDETEPARRSVVVEDLLTMRMGFGFPPREPCPVLEEAAGLGLGVGPPDPSCPLTPDEWIARFARLPLMYQPGTVWAYDLAFGVLGVLLSRAARRPLDVLLQERLLRPLGMADTGFAVPGHARGRLIPCHTRDDQGRLVLFDGVDDSRWLAPPAFPDARGGMVSTAADYLRFARMLLSGGVADDGTRLLSRESVAAMTSDRLDEGQARSDSALPFLQGSGWGYGVEVAPSRRGARAPRYGWGGGLGTVWYSFPGRDTAVVLLTQHMPPPAPLIDALLETVFDLFAD